MTTMTANMKADGGAVGGTCPVMFRGGAKAYVCAAYMMESRTLLKTEKLWKVAWLLAPRLRKKWALMGNEPAAEVGHYKSPLASKRRKSEPAATPYISTTRITCGKRIPCCLTLGRVHNQIPRWGLLT